MNSLPRGVQRQVAKLNSITTGAGAIRFPSEVSRLELRLNKFVTPQSIGAKHFWRQDLPPIQFYNPQIPISVRRFDSENARKSELIVEYKDGSTKVVPAENKPQSEILKELVKLTGAFEIQESEQVRL